MIPLLAVLLAVWGTNPKTRASDYPATGEAGGIALGAEYLVRSLPSGGQMHFVPGYLVVEAAIFPPTGAGPVISNGQFRLRLNGKKQLLFAQTPGIVAASLKYSDWERSPTVLGSARSGDAAVILGRPGRTERFPGDPRPRQDRLPAPPRAPQPEDPSGSVRPPAKAAHEAAVEYALPEGPAEGPVSGYLYFAWKGNPKGIKSAELLFEAAGGSKAILKLQ